MGTGKKIGIGIRLTVMAVCYFLAVHYSENVQDAAWIVVVSLSDGATDEKAESICEEEELSLCFWNEQKDIRFSCRETGKSVQATGLLTKGNPELIVRGSGILTWLERGCVMDIATAQELFGTRQVNGQIVWCGGKAFTVYGTFESLDRTVVLRRSAAGAAGSVSAWADKRVVGLSEGGETGEKWYCKKEKASVWNIRLHRNGVCCCRRAFFYASRSSADPRRYDSHAMVRFFFLDAVVDGAKGKPAPAPWRCAGRNAAGSAVELWAFSDL